MHVFFCVLSPQGIKKEIRGSPAREEAGNAKLEQRFIEIQFPFNKSKHPPAHAHTRGVPHPDQTLDLPHAMERLILTCTCCPFRRLSPS